LRTRRRLRGPTTSTLPNPEAYQQATFRFHNDVPGAGLDQELGHTAGAAPISGLQRLTVHAHEHFGGSHQGLRVYQQADGRQTVAGGQFETGLTVQRYPPFLVEQLVARECLIRREPEQQGLTLHLSKSMHPRRDR
jgi:hypothetical protein